MGQNSGEVSGVNQELFQDLKERIRHLEELEMQALELAKTYHAEAQHLRLASALQLPLFQDAT